MAFYKKSNKNRFFFVGFFLEIIDPKTEKKSIIYISV